MIEAEVSRQVESEYSDDVVAHMKAMEKLTMADPSMIDLQPEIEWHMRPYLLDFLVDTHLSLRLQPQTLFLAVNLINRYCSKRIVFRKHYQLVGCTALWIAAKYEDKKSRIPTLSDLRNMCCKAYDEDMFVQMEGHVLNTLDWTIGHPTIESYLGLCLRSDHNPTVRHVARFLCENSMYHRAFVGLEPSLVASSAHILALHILGYCSTIPSTVPRGELQTINLLAQHMAQPSKSLLRKYSSSSLSQAAQLAQQYVARQQASTLSLPPTPPPSSLANTMTPPSLSSSASSVFSTPGDSPAATVPKPPYARVAQVAPFAGFHTQ
jgi:hypothetical protein